MACIFQTCIVMIKQTVDRQAPYHFSLAGSLRVLILIFYPFIYLFIFCHHGSVLVIPHAFVLVSNALSLSDLINAFLE